MAEPLSPGDRLRLQLAVFVCGAAVMGIEILGTRVIGPQYGVGLFVWTSLITVTLLALAVGYWVGGSLADKHPRVDLFFLLVIGAGAASALIPLLRQPVIEGFAGMGLRAGAMASATVLFFPPLFLLGMISPFAVRLEAQRVDRVGRSAGRLYALSTTGSVFGSILTGFFLVPELRLPTILWSVALVLVLTGALGGGATKLRAPAAAAASVVLIVSLMIAVTPGEEPEGLVAIYPSAYGDLRVVSHEGKRGLMNQGIVQTQIDEADGRPRTRYSYYAVAYLAMARPEARRALVIGMGGGSAVTLFEEQGVETDSVEIDPAVVQAARSHFKLSKERTVHIEDGRTFLRQTDQRYDWMLIDAYVGEQVPVHMTSVEAFELVRDALSSDGVVVLNTLGYLNGEATASALALYRTLLEVFPHVLAVPIDTGEEGLEHLLLFASLERMDPPGRYKVAIKTYPKGQVRTMVWSEFINLPSTGQLLTDDHNPVDLLDLGIREEWRQLTFDSYPEAIRNALLHE